MRNRRVREGEGEERRVEREREVEGGREDGRKVRGRVRG